MACKSGSSWEEKRQGGRSRVQNDGFDWSSLDFVGLVRFMFRPRREQEKKKKGFGEDAGEGRCIFLRSDAFLRGWLIP